MRRYDFNNEELELSDFLSKDRTILANERTLLAYVRTSISLIAGGVSFIKIFKKEPFLSMGWILITLGFIVSLLGLRRFLKFYFELRKIRKLEEKKEEELFKEKEREEKDE
ncbi:MAG: YidH family protein [Fusobacteriota bacterium]